MVAVDCSSEGRHTVDVSYDKTRADADESGNAIEMISEGGDGQMGPPPHAETTP